MSLLQIETIKEEFNEHVEVVDKINQICKNLQFHLNKMKTFEEPPFEKEANIIVDRWLDVRGNLIDWKFCLVYTDEVFLFAYPWYFCLITKCENIHCENVQMMWIYGFVM